MRRASVVPFLLMVLLCIGCDHATKIAAVRLLDGSPPIELARGIVRLELAYNPGAFLGLGAGLPVAFRALVFGGAIPAMVVAASFLFLRDRTLGAAARLSLGLLAGGGLANGLDRALHGGLVTDFVSVGMGPLRTGIFNAADVAVMAGVALLLLSGTLRKDRDGEPAAG